MRKIFRELTPEAAFSKYADTGEERPVDFFLTNFIRDGYRDLKAMCKRYAAEAVECEDGLASIEEINHVAILLEQYIRDYVKKIGGVSKIKLYTEEECEEIFERDLQLFVLESENRGEAKT